MRRFFGAQMTLQSQMDLKHVHPVVVHNNYVIGHSKKQTRFEYFHLWFIQPEDAGFACRSHLIADPNKKKKV